MARDRRLPVLLSAVATDAAVRQVADREVAGGGGRVARRSGGHWVTVICTCGEVRREAVAARSARARGCLLAPRAVTGARVRGGKVAAPTMVLARAVRAH